MACVDALPDGVSGSVRQPDAVRPATSGPGGSAEGPQIERSPQPEAVGYPAGLLHSYHQVFEEFWNPEDATARHLQEAIQKFQESIGVSRYDGAVRTFIANVEAVRSLLGFPFLLSGIAIHTGYHWEAASDGDGRRPFGTHEFMQALASNVLRPEVRQSLQLLLQQSTVLLWGAYETLTRDIFIAALNANPELYKAIESSALKERFPPSSFLTMDVLRLHEFDISHSIGSILAEGKDFSSPWMLEKLLSLLFRDAPQLEDLKVALKSKELRLLGYRRHLVAHRLGVVDDSYVRATGDSQPIGEPLVIRGDDLNAAFSAVLEAALLGLACARQLAG